MATKEIILYRQMLADLGFLEEKATIVYSNSQSAIQLIVKPKFHSRTKHVDIEYHMFPRKN